MIRRFETGMVVSLPFRCLLVMMPLWKNCPPPKLPGIQFMCDEFTLRLIIYQREANGLFVSIPRAGRHAAILMTLIDSCKAKSVEPQKPVWESELT